MIQIRQHDVVTDLAALEQIRATFSSQHCVLLRQFVNPALLARLLPLVASTPAREINNGIANGQAIGRERCLERGSIAIRAFNLLFNNPAVFSLVEQITGSPRIGNFRGRIYMMEPGSGHYDSWHGDNDGNRLIGLSLNLSTDAYSGGAFQIRDRQSERVLGEIFNNVLGDTHIFRIDPDLQHCVATVTGKVTKTAYAGWFRARPDLREMYRADGD